MNGLATIDSGSTLATREAFDAAALSRFIAFVDTSSERTLKTYGYGVRRFLSFIAARGTAQPTREDVIAFRDELKQAGRKTATVKIYVEAVKLFSAWLASEGLYPNIAEHVKVKEKNATIHKKKALTPAQTAAILDRIDRSTEQGRRDYAIFLLMLTCGLRTIEVVRANVGNMDTLGGHTVLYVHGKGHEAADDIVKIPTLTERAIREYLAARTDGSDKDAPLFTSRSNRNGGQRLTTRTVSGMVKKYLREIGSGDDEKLSAHSLRHTMVTEFLKNGGDIREAQRAARHKRLETTEIYADELDVLANRCSATVEAALLGNR